MTRGPSSASPGSPTIRSKGSSSSRRTGGRVGGGGVDGDAAGVVLTLGACLGALMVLFLEGAGLFFTAGVLLSVLTG